MKFSFFALLATLVSQVQSDEHAGTSGTLFYTGFLADMLCTRLEIAPDGANMLLNPESHTVRCELLPACLSSGYGVVTDIGSNGDPLYRVAAVFDESGNNFVADLLSSMEPTVNDLRVRIRSTFVETAPSSVTPAITSTDGERFWPAMNEIPIVTIDQLEFCNYQGPDAVPRDQSSCTSTGSVLEMLASDEGRESLAGLNLCMDEGLSISSEGNDYRINPTGCADHATFQDVKRADAMTCNQTVIGCEEQGSCISDCQDLCGNPLLLPSGERALQCCLDACGNAIYNSSTGQPFLNSCGAVLDGEGGALCPAEQLGSGCIEASCISDCQDLCGNPLLLPSGERALQCCLDACGNAIYNSSTGQPFLNSCGAVLDGEGGAFCPAEQLGSGCESSRRGLSGLTQSSTSSLLPWSDTSPRGVRQSVLARQNQQHRGLSNHGGGCHRDCVDICGNPIPVDISGRTATTCCLNACGQPILNGCGFPYYDLCGSPTTGESGGPCPPENIGKNDVNQCIDGCGSPLLDACGNALDECCLDANGNALYNKETGLPWIDICGNPTQSDGSACEFLGSNMCSTEGDCSPVDLFPPATNSLQCPGLVSPCTLPETAANETYGIPPSIDIGRRRASALQNGLRRMQNEPSVPFYTPLKKDLRFKIPKTPATMRARTELNPAHEGVIGVAVNGVPIVYEHPDEGTNTMLFDSCGGHGDLANRYHYHIPPICLLRSLGGTVPRNSDWWLAPSAETQWPRHALTGGEKSPLIGWALDGYPIFGPYNPDNGELVIPSGAFGSGECSSNVLDECNGMVLESGIYAYFITPTAPFVPSCLMGEVADDAFVDGGLLDSAVETCPFEGTNPLAGTEICDEKTIIFQDETCPGNADRQDIRYCFELATNSFVGEPTCTQMESAITKALPCFKPPGCCLDLDETIDEWKNLYPSLQDCNLPETGCAEFGDDNVVTLTIEIGVVVDDLFPDTKALFRQTIASSLQVEPSQVRIESVTASEDGTSIVVFRVAYSSRNEAIQALETLDKDAVIASLNEATGVPVVTLESELSGPPSVSDTWSTRNKAGLGASVAAVVVLLGLLIYFEEKFSACDNETPAVDNVSITGRV